MDRSAEFASEVSVDAAGKSVSGAVAAPTRPNPHDVWRRVRDLALLTVGPLTVIAVWEYVGRSGLLAGGLFPPFTQVLRAWSEWVFGVGGAHSLYSKTWLPQALASTTRVLVGFAIGSAIAVVVGTLVGWSSAFHKLIDPSVNLIRPISVTAWIPLALIIFGIGDRPAIFLTVLATFFPVYINTYAGVRQAEEKLTRAAQMLGANSYQMLTRVVLPAALPSILTGMRVAAGIAWTTVVVAEMLGAKSGLGYVLIDAYNFFAFNYVIAAMFSIGFLGFFTDRILLWIINRQLRWVGKGAGRWAMRGALLRGGAPFYGVDVGILVLDATFPRPPGDVGHAATFPFPVLYEVVREASPRRVVEDAAQGLLDPFIRAARRLVACGVRGVATSCGFLAIYQRELAAAVPVPVATSSLLQIPLILRTLPPDQTIGVLTINGATLGERHFAGVGITAQERERLRIFGLERTEHLYPVIIGGEQELDVARGEAELVRTAQEAIAQQPDIAAFVLECTNLPPYAAAVQAATERPVYDAVTLITWLHDAVRRPVFVP